MQNSINKFDSSLEFLVKASIATPLTIPLVPASLIVFLLSFIYLQCIYRLAKFFGDSELCEPLKVNSAALALYDSPYKVTPTLIVLPMAVMEGQPDIRNIRAAIRDRLFRKKDERGKLFYPELLWSLRYFMCYPFWKRIPGMSEEMILEKCVRVYNRTGGWDHNSLLDFVKTFAAKKFQEYEPLWEFAVLENYHVQPTERHFAVVVRVHHCLSDGVGGMSLLRDLGNPSEDIKFSLPSGYHVQKVVRPLYRGVYDLLSFAMKGMIYCHENSVWPNNIAGVSLPREPNTLKFSATTSFSMGNCSTLTTVRKVSKAWGVSGTTVMLTAVLRSLRNTLFEEQTILPSYIVMLVPLASPEHSGKLRNAAYLINTLLTLYVENPAAHAREVDEEFQSVKNSTLSYAGVFAGKIGALVPRSVYEFVLGHIENKSEAIVFSTLVGPKDTPYFCGYKIKEFSYLLPLADGTSRFPFFQMISMADKLYLSLSADRRLIEDDAMARKIVMGFHDEIASFSEL